MRTLCLLILALPLCAQDFSEVRIERLASGYAFTEGPVWNREASYLVFSDIPNNRLHRWVPGKSVEVHRENSGGANGNAYDGKGRLISAEGNSRRLTRLDAKGVLETLVDQFEGKPFNAPNDLVVRTDGTIYFTDPAFGRQQDTKALGFFGVYRLSPKGEIAAVWRGSTRPNGIALSPNGRTLYVADSDARLIRAWDLDRAGNATAERVLIQGIDGVPDGLKTDEKGNLYVACRGVAVYSPAGKQLHFIEFPETPANCAFGDPDLQTLYVTARTTVYRTRMPVKGW